MKVTSKALKTVLQGSGSGIGGETVIPPNPHPQQDSELGNAGSSEAPPPATQKDASGTTKTNPGSDKDIELGTDILKDNQPPEEAISFEREDEKGEKDGDEKTIENEKEPSREETNGETAAKSASNSGDADKAATPSPVSPPPPPAPTNGGAAAAALNSAEDETPGSSPPPLPGEPKQEKLEGGSTNVPSGSTPPPPPADPPKRKPAQAKKSGQGWRGCNVWFEPTSTPTSVF